VENNPLKGTDKKHARHYGEGSEAAFLTVLHVIRVVHPDVTEGHRPGENAVQIEQSTPRSANARSEKERDDECRKNAADDYGI
jgi:hypothetical protein